MLAGGTDLLVRMKLKIDRPTHVISVARVPGLDAIIPRDRQGVTVGAGVSAAALSRHELLMDRFTPLALAAGRLGAPMVRNPGHHWRESRERPSVARIFLLRAWCSTPR